MYEGEWREGINIRITSGIPCIKDEVIEHYKEIYDKKEEKDNTIHIENLIKKKITLLLFIQKKKKIIKIRQKKKTLLLFI